MKKRAIISFVRSEYTRARIYSSAPSAFRGTRRLVVDQNCARPLPLRQLCRIPLLSGSASLCTETPELRTWVVALTALSRRVGHCRLWLMFGPRALVTAAFNSRRLVCLALRLLTRLRPALALTLAPSVATLRCGHAGLQFFLGFRWRLFALRSPIALRQSWWR
jgi:hypothetical protein